MILRIAWSPRAATDLEALSESAHMRVRARVAELATAPRQTPTRQAPRSAFVAYADPRWPATRTTFEIVYRVDTNTQELLVERVRRCKPNRSSEGRGSSDLLG
ncbi:MAG: hypothetical protein AMXMBFR46_29090 [Acidimicrobiia bacterium]